MSKLIFAECKKGGEVLNSVSKFFKFLTLILMCFSVLIFSAVFLVDSNTVTNYKIVDNTNLTIKSNIPVRVSPCENLSAEAELYNKVGSKYDVELKIFGIIPVKRANVEIVDDMYVSVLGSPFGMKIYTDGVLIIDISDVDSENGYVQPAKQSGLQIGDFIISIDGQKVYTNEGVAEIIEKSGGKDLSFVIKRDNVIKNLVLKPVLSASTKTYKAGIWVRDSSAGIGTLTFFCPTNNVVCGLGHSVNDNDTGKMLSIGSGEMVAAEIVSLTKAVSGSPGELHGRLLSLKYADFSLNSETGVYGACNGNSINGKMMPVALKQDIKNGEATILTTVENGIAQEYKCKITINKSVSSLQNLIVEITDDELLSKTGGIVQGMSGSPILQNGKLVGAVTHVLIDDPTKGYGIFAENMLETAQNVAGEQKLKDAS